MVAVSTVQLPRCGLFRTTRALDEHVPAGILDNFHNHSDSNEPVIHLPLFNTFNRWQWDKTGRPIRELSWIETLKALPPEGYYLLTKDVRFEKVKWPARSLVQLGYDRSGHPLLFLAQRRFHLAENTLFFADKGMPLPLETLDSLEALVVHEEPDPNELGGEAPVVS